jgi:hypothetical protein
MSDPNTETPYEAVSRQMIVEIEMIVARHLPNLANVSGEVLRRQLSVASVPDDFLEEIAVTIDATPGVGEINLISSTEARDTIPFTRVFHAFAGQLELLARRVRVAVAERRHDVVQRALGVYGTVKGANRPNRKQAIPNVASLRRALGRTGRRKPAEAESTKKPA